MSKWQALYGKFDVSDERLVFKGEPIVDQDRHGPSIGVLISDQRIVSGTVTGTVAFSQITEDSACELLLFYQPNSGAFLTAGLGAGGSLFTIRSFVGGRWQWHAMSGDRENLKPNLPYEVRINVVGSRASLSVGGVDVLSTYLPIVPPEGQAGIWCADSVPITITDFTVQTVEPIAFVVMQFSRPYNELYAEVIKPICNDLRVRAFRADETYGPGFIIADIIRHIYDAHLVVAEITPSNPNVYYEVGYAHAMNKPTILIAEKGTDLPFDVSPFRTLFYENTIEGKTRFEKGFRNHLEAVLSR
jgi:hypothetical protein